MNMKIRITYIVLLLLVLLTGCAKYITPDSGSEATSYIFFSQSLDTKASLVNSSANMDSFGVVGYKYDMSKSWTNTTATDRETVFYDDQALPVNPETIKISNGICSYEPLQGWSNTKKYSFFAYYPLGNDYVTLQTDDSGTPSLSKGSPTIVYEMDCSSATALAASMVDVMTAPCYKDQYAYTSIGNNPTVGDINFAFDHRLSCLGVNVRNSSSGSIKLNSVSLTFTGMAYDQISIPLDNTMSVNKTTTSADTKAATFTIDLLASTENSVTVPITQTGEEGVELSEKLIFIPQQGDGNLLSVRVSVNYTREAANGYQGYSDSTVLPSASTYLTTSLVEGKKHLIYLNFTDSTVDINPTLYSNGWGTPHKIQDTFN